MKSSNTINRLWVLISLWNVWRVESSSVWANWTVWNEIQHGGFDIRYQSVSKWRFPLHLNLTGGENDKIFLWAPFNLEVQKPHFKCIKSVKNFWIVAYISGQVVLLVICLGGKISRNFFGTDDDSCCPRFHNIVSSHNTGSLDHQAHSVRFCNKQSITWKSQGYGWRC